MNTSRRSIQKIVDDQVIQWNRIHAEKKEPLKGISVITISRESGSGGTVFASRLAKELKFDLFHREVIQEMAQSANISERIVKTLDEKGLSVIEDAIASLVNERHLWPDQFLRHLMKVIGTIGKHGRAVIIGRCAHCILSHDNALRIRVIAPMALRVHNISERLDIGEAEAQKRILKTDADRLSFARKYFYADVSDPLHYDLVINTARIGIDTAVESIKGALTR
jgi:cytidylate kinase